MDNNYIAFVSILVVLILVAGVCLVVYFKPIPEELSFDGRFTTYRVDDDKKLLVDNETGVCYLWIWDYNQAGLTAMLNADGSPIIYKEE